MLDQLPADLRQEIMQHYSNQEAAVAANTRNKTANPANNEIKNAPNAFDKLLNHKSPIKHVSPVKKRRGRPAKNSITSTAKKSSSKPTKSVKRCITPTAIETDDDSSKDKEFEDEKVENNLVEEEKYVPTFCGKSDLEDIRPLIKVGIVPFFNHYRVYNVFSNQVLSSPPITNFYPHPKVPKVLGQYILPSLNINHLA